MLFRKPPEPDRPLLLAPPLSAAESAREAVAQSLDSVLNRIGVLETQRDRVAKELEELYSIRDTLAPAVETLMIALEPQDFPTHEFTQESFHDEH